MDNGNFLILCGGRGISQTTINMIDVYLSRGWNVTIKRATAATSLDGQSFRDPVIDEAQEFTLSDYSAIRATKSSSGTVFLPNGEAWLLNG